MPKRPAADPSTAAESSKKRPPSKKAAEPEPQPQPAEQPHFNVDKSTLKKLGWDVPTFEGSEDDLYRWITEPELWASVVMGDVDTRVRRRLEQLHSGLHEEMHASGFVLWRTLPPIAMPFAITLRHSKHPQMPTRRFEFPAVTFKRDRLVPSSHYTDGWEMRMHEGPPLTSSPQPAWLRSACSLIRQVSFPFVGSAMPVVDSGWSEDRFTRADAVTYALCEGSTARARVVAAALCTSFPAERLMRAMINADKNAHAIYVDVICAARYGAAYRLLCDMIAAKRREEPHRPLIVVLMSVASSDVLRRYKRWGFSYGGVMAGAPGETAIYINRLEQLQKELARFEQALGGEGATAPNDVEIVIETEGQEDSSEGEDTGGREKVVALGGGSPRAGARTASHATPRRPLGSSGGGRQQQKGSQKRSTRG